MKRYGETGIMVDRSNHKMMMKPRTARSRTLSPAPSTGGKSCSEEPLTIVEQTAIGMTYEGILKETVIVLKSLLIRVQACSYGHDPIVVMSYVGQRAEECVEENVTRLMKQLASLSGFDSYPSHRITAYAEIANDLTKQVEAVIFDQQFDKIMKMSQEFKIKEDALKQREEAINLELSTCREETSKTTKLNIALESKVDSLERCNEMMKVEVQEALHHQLVAQQALVEVRMQGLDYKAEVDRRAERVMAAVEGQIGYLPGAVEKQLFYVQVLKPPGDPEYDEARRAGDARAEKKYRHMETTLNYSNKDTAKLTHHSTNETMREGGKAVGVYESHDQNNGVEEMKQEMIGGRGSGMDSVVSISQPPQQLHQNIQQQIRSPQHQITQPLQQQQQQQTLRPQPKPQSPSYHPTPKPSHAPSPATYKGPENNQALLKQMMVRLVGPGAEHLLASEHPNLRTHTSLKQRSSNISIRPHVPSNKYLYKRGQKQKRGEMQLSTTDITSRPSSSTSASRPTRHSISSERPPPPPPPSFTPHPAPQSHIGWNETIRRQQPTEGSRLVDRLPHKTQGRGHDRDPRPTNRNHPPTEALSSLANQGRVDHTSGVHISDSLHTSGTEEEVGFETDPDYPAYEHFRVSVDRLRQQIVHGTVASVSTGSGVGSAVRGVNLLDVSAVTQNTTTYPATSQKTHRSDHFPHTSGNTNSSGSSKEQGQGLRKKRRTLAAKRNADKGSYLMRQSVRAYSTRTLQSLEVAATATTTTTAGTRKNNNIHRSQEEEEDDEEEEEEEIYDEEQEEEKEERVGREAARALEAVLQGRRARSPVDWDRWALSGGRPRLVEPISDPTTLNFIHDQVKKDVEAQAAARNTEGNKSSRGTYNEGDTGIFVGQQMPREEVYSSGGSSRGELVSSGGSSMSIPITKEGTRGKSLSVINDSDVDDDEDDEKEDKVRDGEMKDLNRRERDTERVVDGQGNRKTMGFRRKTTTAAEEEEKEYRELYSLPTSHTGGTLRDEDDDDDDDLDLDYMVGASAGINRGTVTGHRRQRYTPPSVNLLDSYMTEIESRGSSRR